MITPIRRYYVIRNIHGVCFVFDRRTNRCVWSGYNLATARTERDRLEAIHTGR